MKATHFNECARCGRSYSGRFCAGCMTAFFDRPDADKLTPKQKAADLVEWRKAELPPQFLRRRVREITGRSYSDLQISADFRSIVYQVRG